MSLSETLITEYLTLQKKFQQQYGPRTILLYMVGIFYETFEYDPTRCESDAERTSKSGILWDEHIGLAIETAFILNSQLTCINNKEPYSIKNPHRAGFPCVALEKNKNRILSHDYIIVRMDQVKDDRGDVTRREVVEIISPSFYINNLATHKHTNNIMCVYLECQSTTFSQHMKMENLLIICGASILDVITGKNTLCEFYSKNNDQIHAIQELYRFLICNNPRELVIYIDDLPDTLCTDDVEHNPYVSYLHKTLELHRYDRLKIYVNQTLPDYKKITYQTEFLNKVFPRIANGTAIQIKSDNILSELEIDALNYARISYILLLQYCYSHNKNIIQLLSKPTTEWIDNKKHLVLAHDSLLQLDIFPKNIVLSKNKFNKIKEVDSLLAILDENKTHMGRRMLINLIQNPLTSTSELETHYQMIEEMFTPVVDGSYLWKYLEQKLGQIPDLSSLHRKLEMKTINPSDLCVLFNSYIKIMHIYIDIYKLNTPTLHNQMLSSDEVNSFNDFMVRYNNIFNLEHLASCKIATDENGEQLIDFVTSPIREQLYSDLDMQVNHLVDNEAELQTIINYLEKYLQTKKPSSKKSTSAAVAKNCIERKTTTPKKGAVNKGFGGTILTTTPARSTILSSAPLDHNICGQLEILPLTSTEKHVSGDKIALICSQIDQAKKWLRTKIVKIYYSVLEEMVLQYNFYDGLVRFVSKIDVIHSYAKITHQYNYFKPTISHDNHPESFIEAEDIRHPIIERIISGEYITNDVRLGRGISGSNRSYGMGLYGYNATGKTSLAKAVALNIIMAQIGCFTPSKMTFKPYHKIITSLTSDDNLFKSQSSNTVEMIDLRTMLRQADANTYCALDELCSTTESNSGLAITSASILTLIDRRATFILATHMHDLIKIPCIEKLNSNEFKIFHLAVRCNDENKCLIYDRKLKDGSGPSVYGLIVAQTLDLPQEFLDQAFSILDNIINKDKSDSILSTKTSRYNSEVYVDSCAMCHTSTSELHTHHIEEQHLADERGMIGSMHKNVKNNLIVLCSTCHKDLHSRGQELKTLQTSVGRMVIAAESDIHDASA